MIKPALGARLPGALILALGILACAHSQGRLEAERAGMRASASPLFFPSPKTVKLVALGHRVALADVLYLWSIQYFGDETIQIQDRRGWLVRVYDTITDLDPRFSDAYWLGFVSLLYEAESPDDAFRLADKSLANNPKFTWMAIEAAMTARQLGREEQALGYLRKGSESGDVMARRFLVRLEAVDFAQQELAAWEELEDEDDELTRAIARSHVRDLTVLVDTESLAALARCYRAERGLAPANLEQLATAGYVSAVPPDPEGKPYVYDPRTMTVRSVSPYRHSPPSRSKFGVDLSPLGRCRPAPPAPAPEAPSLAAPEAP